MELPGFFIGKGGNKRPLFKESGGMIMRKFIMLPILILFGVLLFASPGWCIAIDDTNAGILNGEDVGSIDTLLGTTDALANSNPTTETIWVNEVLAPLGSTATYQVKDEPVTYYSTDTEDVYAFAMSAPYSEYFLIKNSTWWALYENSEELGFGVFDTAELNAGFNLPNDDVQISHVTRFNPKSVPEPATVLLLGLGLVGLAGLGRKRIKS